MYILIYIVFKLYVARELQDRETNVLALYVMSNPTVKIAIPVIHQENTKIREGSGVEGRIQYISHKSEITLFYMKSHLCEHSQMIQSWDWK